MNRMIVIFFTGFLLLNIASGIRGEETTAQFGRFGKIALYHPSAHPAHVVLFVSGDGGWNLGVVDMARELAALDALVVGVDITYYLKQLESSPERCAYPAADFELLSKYVQKKNWFSPVHNAGADRVLVRCDAGLCCHRPGPFEYIPGCHQPGFLPG